MKRTIFIFLFSTLFLRLFAQDIIQVEESDELISIGKQVQYLEDFQGGLQIEDIIESKQQKRFVPIQTDIFRKPHLGCVYWYRLTVQNNSQEILWLKIGNNFDTWEADLYTADSLGNYIREQSLGLGHPEKPPKYLPYHYYYLKLSTQKQPKTYYLRIGKSFGRTHKFQIGKIEDIVQQQKKYDYIAIAFISLIIALGIYNLFLFYYIHEYAYIYYAGYLLMTALVNPFSYGFYDFGYIGFTNYFFIWQMPLPLFVTLFTTSFLKLKQTSPRWNIWVWFLTILLVVVIPFAHLFWSSIELADIYDTIVSLYAVNLLILGYYLLYKGHANLVFYPIAWTFAISGVLTRILTIHGILPPYVIFENALYIGIGIESILFSLALGYSYNRLRTEKEIAQTKNLKLIQEQNEVLEKKVKHRTEELQAMNEELVQSNEELRLLNEKLDQQGKELKQLNTSKDQIFAIIGHDLRSPISSLYSLLLMIKKEEMDIEYLYELSDKLHQNVENIYSTLENLLSWAKSQMEGIVTEPQVVSLFELAREPQNLLSQAARDKNIQIVNEIDPSIKVFADPEQVRMVIRNLLSNAIKFSFSGKTITIASRKQDSFQEIAISDEGAGIPPEKVGQLFNRKISESTYGTQGEKGTGLGLFLCQEFIENNGGKIWAESEEGKGSTFYFTLLLSSRNEVELQENP